MPRLVSCRPNIWRPPRDREEKNGWREEDANVVVGKAQGFKAGRDFHFVYRSHGTSGDRPLHTCETQNPVLLARLAYLRVT